MREIGEFLKGLFRFGKKPLPPEAPTRPPIVDPAAEQQGIAAAQRRQEQTGQDWLRNAARTMPEEATTAARNALEDLAQRRRLGIDEGNVIEGQFRPAEEKPPTPPPGKR